MACNSEINIQFKSQEEINDYAALHNKVLVLFDDYVLDATSFAQHHPGGAGLIHNYRSKDITPLMETHHPLSLKMANSLIIGSFEKEINRVIDPRKALMEQIWNLDHQSYLKIVESPHWLFVPSPPMFQSQFLEFFSHNKWYHIFLLPFIYCAIMWYCTESTGAKITALFSWFIVGVFSFSLCEYLLHRFIFHSEKHLFDNKAVRYVHFLLHGIHHMLPNDPDRLVYPPFLATCTVFVGYWTVCWLIFFDDKMIQAAFWTGFLVGYLIYDVTHYMLHHIDTTKHRGGYFHRLQKYHNQHHFGGEEAGFGVSSKFWDIIFRTEFTREGKHGKL